MKKVKLILVIAVALLLLTAVILLSKFILSMLISLNRAGNEDVSLPASSGYEGALPWETPSLSDMAYEASEPKEDPVPEDLSGLVTVPVLQTPEELAEEADAAG